MSDGSVIRTDPYSLKKISERIRVGLIYED